MVVESDTSISYYNHGKAAGRIARPPMLIMDNTEWVSLSMTTGVISTAIFP